MNRVVKEKYDSMLCGLGGIGAAAAFAATGPGGGLLVIAAVWEELLFRDVLLRRWLLGTRKLSPALAVGLSALLFSALHLLNLPGVGTVSRLPAQAALALLFGLASGAWVCRTGSVWLPMAVHMGINLAAALGGPLPALYIDPGTGAMLFTILTGLLGVARFALKGSLVKLRFFLSGGKKAESDRETDAVPLAIFSDDKRYWPVFEPVCRELDRRGVEVLYLTASPDDPALENGYDQVKAEFIGEGNRAFSRLNFLKATILLSTTPGLDVYQWKRSKDVKYYVHLPHMAGELTTYRMFGTDYYDALLLSGQYQIDDCRALEKLRGLPEKECVLVGIPYLDEKEERLRHTEREEHPRTVLVAPSWGKNSLLNRFGNRLIDLLIETGYHIVIRPHPQSFTSEKELIARLMADYPDLEWNRDTDNFDILNRADILISDFSGVIFDFALVFQKPVICAYTDFDKSPLDAWWLDTPIWTATAVPRLGPILTEESFPRIKELIDDTLADDSRRKDIALVRQETWAYPGQGAGRAADYLTAKLAELSAEPEKE